MTAQWIFYPSANILSTSWQCQLPHSIVIVFGYKKKKCPVLWHPVENRAEYKLHENSLEASITMDNEQSA